MQLGSIDTHAHDVFTHSFVYLFVHPSIHPEHSLIDATTHLIIYACLRPCSCIQHARSLSVWYK